MKNLLNDPQVKDLLIGVITSLACFLVRAIEKGHLRIKGKLKDGKGGTVDNSKKK